MDEKKTGGWGRILGGIVLIVLLFGGINFVFWVLDQVIPKNQADVSYSVSQDASVPRDTSGEPDAPSFCVHCGRALPESFQWGQFCPWCGEKNER